jgi:membrane protease YdiL (CAAX protease family)
MDPEHPTAGKPDPIAAWLRGFGLAGALFIIVVLLVGPLIGSALVLLWAWHTKTPWRDLGFQKPHNWFLTIAGGITAGVALKLLMKAVVMPLIGAPPINPAYHYLAGNTGALPGTLLNVIVSAGIGEEIIWRGFLFERLGHLVGGTRRAQIATVLITATLFGLAHYSNQRWMGVEQAFIVGLVLGTYYTVTRKIVPLMVAHAAFDVFAILIIYWNLEEKVAHLVFH